MVLSAVLAAWILAAPVSAGPRPARLPDFTLALADGVFQSARHPLEAGRLTGPWILAAYVSGAREKACAGGVLSLAGVETAMGAKAPRFRAEAEHGAVRLVFEAACAAWTFEDFTAWAEQKAPLRGSWDGRSPVRELECRGLDDDAALCRLTDKAGVVHYFGIGKKLS